MRIVDKSRRLCVCFPSATQLRSTLPYYCVFRGLTFRGRPHTTTAVTFHIADMPDLSFRAKIGISIGILQAMRAVAVIAIAVAYYWWRRRVHERAQRVEDGIVQMDDEDEAPPAYEERV